MTDHKNLQFNGLMDGLQVKLEICIFVLAITAWVLELSMFVYYWLDL